MVSVVIPAYNEGEKIGRAIDTVKRFLHSRDIPHELIIVDDGSRDDTRVQAQRAAERWKGISIQSLPSNRGKGAAVRRGVLSATGDPVCFLDADLSTPIETLPAALDAIAAGADVVIGSRHVAGARIEAAQPAVRQQLGRYYTWLANRFTGANVADFTCGFKVFTRDAADALFRQQRLTRWSFDAELLFLARRNGFSVSELPVVWTNDRRTKVHLIGDVFRSFAELLLLRWYSVRGRYTRHGKR